MGAPNVDVRHPGARMILMDYYLWETKAPVAGLLAAPAALR